MLLPKSTFEAGWVSGLKLGEKLLVKRFGLSKSSGRSFHLSLKRLYARSDARYAQKLVLMVWHEIWLWKSSGYSHQT